MATPAGAAYQIKYVKTLELSEGVRGTPRPVSVSIEPQTGEILVVDGRSPAFHVINSRGIEVFHTGVLAHLSAPKDGGLDGDGSIVFPDVVPNERHRGIRQLHLNGEENLDAANFISPDSTWHPDYLTITRSGDYLTFDSGNGILAKHDPQTGELMWVRHFFTETAHELHMGRPFEAADGRIFLPAGEKHNVLVLSSEGDRLTQFGQFGGGPGKMVFPTGVAAGPDGTILVLDRMRHKVLVFDENYRFLMEYGAIGAGLGHFYHPSAIASTPDGSFYVAQGYMGRVQMFRIAKTAD